MKKMILAIAAIAMLAACKETKSLQNVGEQVWERRMLSGFERIELLGSMDVRYVQADSFSVRVKAPQKLINDVKTELNGNRLIVSMKDRTVHFTGYGDHGVTVYVTSPDLIGIALKGSGDFDTKGQIDTDTLDVILRGSGDIDLKDVICDRIQVSLAGSGDVEVKRVKARQADIDLQGSGDVEMNFDYGDVVEARLKGSGDIKLRGTVGELKSNALGSGSIKKEGLNIKR